MSSTLRAKPQWRAHHAAHVGAGHFALAQGEDGAWRVALVDEWRIERRALQAAFDTVHPDGTLDFCGDFLNKGHLPQDLGRADAFFAKHERECALIDELWSEGTGAEILAKAPLRWRAWTGAVLPALIRAKAAYRLAELSSGRAPTKDGALTALAGALQENIELCGLRSRGVDPDILAKLDASDEKSSKLRRRRKNSSAATDD